MCDPCLRNASHDHPMTTKTRYIAIRQLNSKLTCTPNDNLFTPAALKALEKYTDSVQSRALTSPTYHSFVISADVGLASKVISALDVRVTFAATALITASTVEGFAKLGVPADR